MMYLFNRNWVDTRWQHYITHLHTNSTQNIEKGEFRKCGPCPVFASYTLAFALQLRKRHGKTSIRVAQYKNNKQAQYKNNEQAQYKNNEQAQYKNMKKHNTRTMYYTTKQNNSNTTHNNKEHRIHNRENC